MTQVGKLRTEGFMNSTRAIQWSADDRKLMEKSRTALYKSHLGVMLLASKRPCR